GRPDHLPWEDYGRAGERGPLRLDGGRRSPRLDGRSCRFHLDHVTVRPLDAEGQFWARQSTTVMTTAAAIGRPRRSMCISRSLSVPPLPSYRSTSTTVSG